MSGFTALVEWVLALPWYIVIPTLWAGAMLRSNATHWLGRGTRHGAGALWRRVRPGRGTEATQRRRPLAERLVRTLGPLAVVIGFFTVGLQSAIMFTSGVARMPLKRFVPATMIGSLGWALIYATIGMAALEAFVLALTGSWWGALLLLGIVAIAVTVLLLADRLLDRWRPHEIVTEG
ncbi:DedA family protein [Granulicoccus phenolivorans]|uniref:DedA family protein n=1 Tax=Granulicoccus phenolivorans TaxID=266854 RepID=UPI0003F4F161|nr:VTT domain-containing protein [Granulicoccus phenolivorans]